MEKKSDRGILLGTYLKGRNGNVVPLQVVVIHHKKAYYYYDLPIA